MLINLIFIILYLILGIKILPQGLFLDDFSQIIPSLTNTQWSHFLNYTHDYGLLRPVGFWIMYGVYSIYLFSPIIAYILMFTIHFATGYSLFLFLKKKINSEVGLINAIIYISFPLITEEYAWLASIFGIMANLILIGQLMVISIEKLSIKLRLSILFILQLFGVLIYEKTIIMFLPIMILLLLDNQNYRKISNYLKFSLLVIPTALYLFLRKIVFPAHVINYVRELSLSDLINGNWIHQIIQNLEKFYLGTQYLIWGDGKTQFWMHNFINGLNVIGNNFFILLLIIFLFILIGAFYYNNFSKHNNINKYSVMFVGLAIICLIPSLFLLKPTFPFRVIALPLIFLIIAANLFLYSINIYIVRAISSLFIALSLIVTISVLDQMSIQSKIDTQLINNIVKSVNNQNNKKVVVVLLGVPQSPQTKFNYGEYLNTCFFYDWCALPALKRYSDKIDKIYINKNNIPIEQSKNYITLYFDKIK